MRFLIALALLLWAFPVQALTQAEKDMHIRRMIANGVEADVALGNEPSPDLCRWMVMYARTGADEKTAMKWAVKQLHSRYRPTFPNTAHVIRHWLLEACEMDRGEGLHE